MYSREDDGLYFYDSAASLPSCCSTMRNLVVLDRSRSRVEVIDRDHDGRCVAACSEPILGVLEPEMMDALAI